MRVNTAELAGPALDWAVAECTGVWKKESPQAQVHLIKHPGCDLRYSTDWSMGGPILEQMRARRLEVLCQGDGSVTVTTSDVNAYYDGASILEAAMRCFVAGKLGDELDVPDALCPARPAPRKGMQP